MHAVWNMDGLVVEHISRRFYELADIVETRDNSATFA